MCYHVKFGTSTSKDVCINRREPPKLGSTGSPPLVIGAWLTPTNTTVAHLCYPAEFGCYMSNGTSVIKEIHLENLTLRVSPFKVTHGHQPTHRSGTYDFLLTFHSNYGPNSYRSEINGDFSRKSQIFPPHVFNVPAEGFALELDTGVGNKELE